MISVSIIVPNFNHALYLDKRFETIFNQTFTDYEVIILDDCSTDNSIEVINRYKEHPKVSQVFINEVNSGSVFKQWNKGVNAAKGDFIWIAESDDWSELNFVEELFASLIDKKVGLAFCNTNIYHQIEDKLSNTRSDQNLYSERAPLNKSVVMEGQEFFFDYFSKYNIINNVSSVLFRKEAYLLSGGAPENMRNAGDWMLYFKIFMKYKFAYINQDLNYWRRHPAVNTTVTKVLKLESISIIKECILYQKKYRSKISRSSLEGYYIWCFDGFWNRKIRLSIKNLLLYLKYADRNQFVYLIRNHWKEMIILIANKVINTIHSMLLAKKQ